MGKIRRQRKKFHLSKNADCTDRSSGYNKSCFDFKSNVAPLPLSCENIWDGFDLSKDSVVKINPQDSRHTLSDAGTSSEARNLATSLALLPQGDILLREDDARTTISMSKSVFKNRGVNKEERRKLRHQTFIERINAIQAMKKTKQNKRNKCLVNQEPSTSGTNTAFPLPQESAKPMAMRQGGIVKSQVRHKRMLKDISVLTKLWENPEYKADPSGFVSEMVQERVAKEIQ